MKLPRTMPLRDESSMHLLPQTIPLTMHQRMPVWTLSLKSALTQALCTSHQRSGPLMTWLMSKLPPSPSSPRPPLPVDPPSPSLTSQRSPSTSPHSQLTSPHSLLLNHRNPFTRQQMRAVSNGSLPETSHTRRAHSQPHKMALPQTRCKGL